MAQPDQDDPPIGGPHTEVEQDLSFQEKMLWLEGPSVDIKDNFIDQGKVIVTFVT